MAHIAADEPDETAETITDAGLTKALANIETKALIAQMMSDTIAEATRPIAREVEAMNRRLDKLLLSLAPVRSSVGRRHYG